MEIYKDPSKPVAQRVEDLLSKMTLEEKAAQLCGNLPSAFISESTVSDEKLKEVFPNGMGRITQFSTSGLCDVMTMVKAVNKVQHYCMEETRLGIPCAIQTESLCGLPVPGATLFPAMINAGSTWEPELVGKMAEVIGQESRDCGINSTMSPVLDCARDERWGRVYETFGEDPYLNSQMGIAYVKNNQNDKKGVACIGKHFVGYSETQGGMNCTQARINDRELYEVFCTPFEAAMKEADISGVMANYGEIDGMNVLANKKISIDLLRKTMQFRGMLTSDGAGVRRLWNHYRLTRTYEDAGILAKNCGADTEIPVGDAFAKLPQAVREGKVSEECLDESVRRILTIKFEYGLFENPYVTEDNSEIHDALSNSQKKKLSETIARDSIILLKNDGCLPLAAHTKVAVVGPHADSLRYPISGYTYPAYIEMAEAFRDNVETSIGGMADLAAGKKKQTGVFNSMFAMYSSEDVAKLPSMNQVIRNMGGTTLKEELEKKFDVKYAEGCSIIGDDERGINEAVRIAEESDVVICALGGNCGWVNVTGGEGKDRSSFELPGVQEKLLEKVTATGKKVIVVLYGPQIFSVKFAKKHCAAIIQAFMPGPSAGKVICDVLDGTSNPGGKLTVTIPASAGQAPVFYNHHVGSGYTDAKHAEGGVFSGGYVNEDFHPLYVFGYGLSYTTFRLENMRLSSDTCATGGMIDVAVDLTNTGDCEGSETVQLYEYFEDANVIRPNKQLCGFLRVKLKPGEKKTVKFHLSTRELGYYNENMEFVVEPGELSLMIGTSSDDIVMQKSVMLTGEKLDVMHNRVYTCPAEAVADGGDNS